MSIQSIKQRFGIVGNSPALNYAISIAERVAPTNLSVLIAGESGTGKEVFSQIIHQLSSRKHNKFIAVNCGAIPEGTIDSELFGHEKGAFTGANDKRKGYFETVDGGTIFLDEIGEMPVDTQARLLRVLETGEFIKVGSSKEQKTDVRVVAATNKNLLNDIKKGKFREDLYYRLCTVQIETPPLRDRGNDIELLFRKFSSDFAEKNRMENIRLSEDAKQLLLQYNWPGNVRQLKNIAEQATILSDNKEINAETLSRFIPDMHHRNLPQLYDDSSTSISEREILYKVMFDLKKDMNDLKQFVLQMAKSNNFSTDDLKDIGIETNHQINELSGTPQKYHFQEPNNTPNKQAVVINSKDDFLESEEIEESLSLADMEKTMIVKSLEKYNGKRKDAAEELGISERTLYRKIKEYRIDL
ncbi:MAG: sigma-54 dependent transcriptional regulator [Chitinophagales bacterium]|nr:sigma-54-dependent Fis family transcriptional regulator [Bacteroidota bacterium]MCB9227161.1 sigma-54-dependent Fis family transcriptional regulator [Chitinophagales bacterium]